MKISCKSIFFYAFVTMIISCQEKIIVPEQDVNAPVSVDSLIGLWNNAWNSHDSAALANMFSKNATVVFSDKERLVGSDSIMVNWVSNNLPSVANLKTETITSSASNGIAYYAGNYSLDVMRDDSVISSDISCFTSIWKRDQENSWKIELIFFGVHDK